MAVTRLMSLCGGMATFGQVLVALPMTLDLLGVSNSQSAMRMLTLNFHCIGPPSFLLLSLLFTLHHFAYSTLRLLLKNTVLAPIISLLSFLSPILSTLSVIITLYFYLHPPNPDLTSTSFVSLTNLVVNVLPYFYASILRWVSPLFTLLEGISTLLVIQVAGRVGKGWADEEESGEEGIEWRSLLGLVAAALVYCAGLAGVVQVDYQSD
jgi:hypothetical protein